MYDDWMEIIEYPCVKSPRKRKALPRTWYEAERKVAHRTIGGVGLIGRLRKKKHA